MSQHGKFYTWKLDQPAPKGLVDDIVEAVRYNEGWPMFAIGCDEDRIIAYLMGLRRPIGPLLPDPLPQPARAVLREAEQRLGKRN